MDLKVQQGHKDLMDLKKVLGSTGSDGNGAVFTGADGFWQGTDGRRGRLTDLQGSGQEKQDKPGQTGPRGSRWIARDLRDPQGADGNSRW